MDLSFFKGISMKLNVNIVLNITNSISYNNNHYNNDFWLRTPHFIPLHFIPPLYTPHFILLHFILLLHTPPLPSRPLPTPHPTLQAYHRTVFFLFFLLLSFQSEYPSLSWVTFIWVKWLRLILHLPVVWGRTRLKIFFNSKYVH